MSIKERKKLLKKHELFVRKAYIKKKGKGYYELFVYRKGWYYEFLVEKGDLFQCRKLAER